MSDYGDALQAFRNTFKTGNIIDGYSIDTIIMFSYGWLTAKGIPCSLSKLSDKIRYSDQIRK